MISNFALKTTRRDLRCEGGEKCSSSPYLQDWAFRYGPFAAECTCKDNAFKSFWHSTIQLDALGPIPPIQLRVAKIQLQI